MNAWEFLSTPEKERVLRRLLYSSSKESIRGIARDAGVSPGQVHKYLSILQKNKLAGGGVVTGHPIVVGLRLLENLIFLENHGVVASIIRSQLPHVRGVGLYGSWARGTNDEKADIDLWVLTEKMPSDLTVGKLRRTLQEKTGKSMDLIVLTSEKLKNLKARNQTFYYALVNSLKLWGTELWSI